MEIRLLLRLLNVLHGKSYTKTDYLAKLHHVSYGCLSYVLDMPWLLIYIYIDKYLLIYYICINTKATLPVFFFTSSISPCATATVASICSWAFCANPVFLATSLLISAVIFSAVCLLCATSLDDLQMLSAAFSIALALPTNACRTALK